MKVIKVKIINEGKAIEIETNHKGNYRFVWLQANNLIDIASFTEKL